MLWETDAGGWGLGLSSPAGCKGTHYTIKISNPVQVFGSAPFQCSDIATRVMRSPARMGEWVGLAGGTGRGSHQNTFKSSPFRSLAQVLLIRWNFEERYHNGRPDRGGVGIAGYTGVPSETRLRNSVPMLMGTPCKRVIVNDVSGCHVTGSFLNSQDAPAGALPAEQNQEMRSDLWFGYV